jgi:hypothetical protein
MVNLACQEEVSNPTEWTSTSKADMMDTVKQGRYALAMNMAIWNCTATTDWTTVTGCVMETGAFEDNTELKLFVRHLAPFPLSPESLFGVQSGGFVTDGEGLIFQDVDWDDRPNTPIAQTDIRYSGGVINEAMFGLSSGYKFVKVSKDVYADKQFMLTPLPEQIGRIKSARAGETVQWAFFLWLILCGIMVGALKSKN